MIQTHPPQRYLTTARNRRWPMHATAIAMAFSACKPCTGSTDADNETDKEGEHSTAASSAAEADASKSERLEAIARFGVLPKEVPPSDYKLSEAKVELGRALYYDTRLSLDNDLSCNSCHDLNRYGADGHATSPGHKGKSGARNSPTVLNAAGHIAQFWDGRAKTVEEQAKGPVLNPDEMAMPDAKTVEKRLEKEPFYQQAFAKAFPDEATPVSFEHMAIAIGAFERKLMTPSRWDTYQKEVQAAGQSEALSATELKGFDTFVATGCPSCHNGTYLGGNQFQRLGLVKPWPNQDDLGRYEVTKQDADKLMFKVPSLRNVAETAPYFHDGSEADLSAAVKKMAHHQLGRTLADDEVDAIVAFLKALSGEVDKALIRQPGEPT